MSMKLIPYTEKLPALIQMAAEIRLTLRSIYENPHNRRVKVNWAWVDHLNYEHNRINAQIRILVETKPIFIEEDVEPK